MVTGSSTLISLRHGNWIIVGGAQDEYVLVKFIATPNG